MSFDLAAVFQVHCSFTKYVIFKPGSHLLILTRGEHDERTV